MATLTLADGRRYVGVTLTKPTGYDTGSGVLNVSLASLTAPGFIANAHKQINFADWQMGPTGSDTVDIKPLGTKGKSQIFAASNFGANCTVLRDTDEDGLPTTNDTLFIAIGAKGVISFWITRTGPFASEPLAIGDSGFIYECMSDDPKEQEDEADVLKNNVPLTVLSRRPFKITA